MGLFFTGKGDQGESFVGPKKYPKDHPALEALGDLDELNSFLGWIKSAEKGVQAEMGRLQEDLFVIQAHIGKMLYPDLPGHDLPQDRIAEMEQEIDAIEQQVDPERAFVVSGTNPLSAQLDYARTIARRAERRAYVLHKQSPLPEEILKYLNRLSSYLYALARKEAFERSEEEPHPTYE